MKENESDGPCCVCGKPGRVQGLPDAPASFCYCKDCAPCLTLKPLTIVFWLVVLAVTAWLGYTWFIK
jgi:hypothetical protein